MCQNSIVFRTLVAHTFNNHLFFFREFQFIAFASDDSIFIVRPKIPIGFWCKRGLNFKSLIQPSETFLVELIATHNIHVIEQIRLLFVQLISNYKFKSVYHRLRVRGNKLGPRICVQFFQNTF